MTCFLYYNKTIQHSSTLTQEELLTAGLSRFYQELKSQVNHHNSLGFGKTSHHSKELHCMTLQVNNHQCSQVRVFYIVSLLWHARCTTCSAFPYRCYWQQGDELKHSEKEDQHLLEFNYYKEKT